MKAFQIIRLLLFVVGMACFLPGCEKTGGMGPQGLQGEDGAKGQPGDRGPSGSKGTKGDRGNTGPNGAKGPKGDRGDTGSRGATGARGPKGERGDAGPGGPAGPRGAQGAVGVGNVIYSNWIIPSEDDLNADGHLELITPKLTSAMLNTGEVYIYLRDAYDPSARVYPIEGYFHSYYNFRFSIEVGRITIYTEEVFVDGARQADDHPLIPRYASHGLQDPDPILDYAYRYVFIPGGTKTSLNINPADYRSVRQQLALPEPTVGNSI